MRFAFSFVLLGAASARPGYSANPQDTAASSPAARADHSISVDSGPSSSGNRVPDYPRLYASSNNLPKYQSSSSFTSSSAPYATGYHQPPHYPQPDPEPLRPYITGSVSQPSQRYPLGNLSDPLQPYPTGAFPHRPNPYITGSRPVLPDPYPTVSISQPSPYWESDPNASKDYITTTSTETITTTVPVLVPYSSETTSNGQAWWTTFLATSYYSTTYTDAATIVYPSPSAPVSPSQPWSPPYEGSFPEGDAKVCPPGDTVTVTQLMSSPAPSQYPSDASLVTDTIAVTLSYDYTTTLTLIYPVPSTTISGGLVPPYPNPNISTSNLDPYPTGGYPDPSGYPLSSDHAPHPSVYARPTGYQHPSNP